MAARKKNKKLSEIRALRASLQGILDQSVETPMVDRIYGERILDLVNGIIYRLNFVSGEDFDNYKISLECGVDYITLMSLRQRVDALIRYLDGKYFIHDSIARKDIKMSDDERKLNVGDDSVVMGAVTGSVGHRSVVIGGTDDQRKYDHKRLYGRRAQRSCWSWLHRYWS